MKYLFPASLFLCLSVLVTEIQGQDLDPRAYVRVPVNINFIGAGFGYSEGGVVTDPSGPIQNVQASLFSPSLVIGHTFSMFGKTAQVSTALPYAWAEASGTIGEVERSTTRSGFCDMRLKCSVLFMGAPAATQDEIVQTPQKTILGASLIVIAPTGQYFPEKLINLGTNRWSVKPELALSQPISKRWLFDLYAGVWLFTENKSYYTGNSTREQNPIGSFQAHISYNINPGFWAALNCTYYVGGETSINGILKDDFQQNSRFGGTIVLPLKKRHSIKVAFSRGAIIRVGANFTTVSLGWQMVFFNKSAKSKS